MINFLSFLLPLKSDSITFLGSKLLDSDDFSELVFRFLFNLCFLLMLIFLPYLRHSTRRKYTFSYLAVGMVVFLLCFLLSNIKLELGFALGLFAIFGIIRYRTDAIPFKQMTYLFVVIGISVINALATSKVSYAELLFANIVIIMGLWALESYLDRKPEGSMTITYENISNVHTSKHDILLADLCERTGYKILHFEVKEIDYLKDVAEIEIYFALNENNYSPSDEN